MQLKHEKKITFFVVSTFIAQPLLAMLAAVVYPPDFSKEFPVYDSNSIMLIVCGNALGIAGLTVPSIKLADEKKNLPAAGFTMLAISMGIVYINHKKIQNKMEKNLANSL